MQPCLNNASKDQIGNLAKGLFEHIYNTDSTRSAFKITTPFGKKIIRDTDENMKIAGDWEFGNGSALTISDDIRSADINREGNEGDGLELKSVVTSKHLIYHGDLERWDSLRDAVTVEMDLEYHPTTDTITGSVSVEPCGENCYGSYGDDFSFTASRSK